MVAATRLVCSAAIWILTSFSYSYAQSRPATPYSNEDIDNKLSELRHAIDGESDSRAAGAAKVQDALSTLSADLKALRQAGDSAVKAAEAKASNDVAALGSRIDQLARLNEVRLDDLNGRLPTAPWWASPILGAGLGAVAGFFSSWVWARRASTENDRLRRRAAAQTACSEWLGMNETIAKALFLIKNPDHLIQADDRNIVVGYANWLDKTKCPHCSNDITVNVTK
jgi:hypothetical protein